MNSENGLKSIKFDSIKSIFSAIADEEKVSRADVAEKTGLSLVTVGKIADALLLLDIIDQEKEVRNSAGRRAGMLNVNSERFALIIDITTRDFRCSIHSLKLSLVEKRIFTYNFDKEFIDNLREFLSTTVREMYRQYGTDNCFGVGVAVPGPYNKESDSVMSNRIPELSKIRIMNEVYRIVRRNDILIESQINAASRSNILMVDDYKNKNILYWYLGDKYVCGAFTYHGELVLGKNEHACDFGRILVGDTTLEERVSRCTDENECAKTIKSCLFSILNIINPHVLIMEFDTGYCCDNMIDMLKDSLINEFGMSEDSLPEFRRACYKYRNSHRGLSMQLREAWLRDIVFETEERK